MVKKINILVLLICLVMQFGFAKTSDTTRIYFDINKKNLSHFTNKLDSVTQIKDIVKINIIGYTDYLGTDAYNLELSKQRANAVKNYFSKRLKSIPISAIGKGEIASLIELSLGEPKSRRVDIIITRESNLTKPKVENTSNTKKDILLIEEIEKIKVGETIVLESLHFIGGRHFLLPESETQLTTLYNVLYENKNIKVEIQGHVCCTADYDGYDYDTQNFTLSVNRAKYIYERLIEMGIEKSRLKYSGLGSKFPRIWPEVTEEDKSTNRRVEIKILAK